MYFLLAGTDGQAGPDTVESFATLEEALEAIGRRESAVSAGSRAASGPQQLEIVRQRPGALCRPGGKARYHFYVNGRATGSGGEGTDLAPWWGIPAAVDGLLRLHRAGQLGLQPGHRIRIAHRDVFTAASFERWKKIKETIAKFIFMGMTMGLVLPVFIIFGFLLVKAWPVLSFSFLLENPRNYMTAGGIWAPLVGTFSLVFLSLAVMSLPVIITATREALSAVPMAFREACWNMGATRWQTIRTIVLPNSISGIMTGVIFEVARAAGETAPILLTGAVFFTPVADHGWASFFPYRLGDRCMALSMHLFTLSTQVRGVAEEVQYGTAVVLFGLVLAANSLSIGLRAYLRSRKKW